MKNLKTRIIKFMSGRYGYDRLGKFLFILYIFSVVIASIIDLFLDGILIAFIRFLPNVLALYAICRMLSRNIYARRSENQKYLSVKSRLDTFFNLRKSIFRDRKTHVYRSCPACNAVLRLKKIKGAHSAACPRCGMSFKVVVK